MKLVTLMENTACGEEFVSAHGLSLYLETPRHKILFDMGPDGAFADNADKLGVDLGGVDVAVLSHGHSDHGGGLKTFFERNGQADVLIQQDAFGDYYAVKPGREPRYIGLSPDMWEYEYRFLPLGERLRLDDELTLFSDVPDVFPALAASAKLKEKRGGEFVPDRFRHEQSLLVTAEGKAVLLAGCAHRGIVNIIAGAAAILGRRPEIVVAGFHLFELEAGAPGADELIDATAAALLEGGTVYYTGHCTGAYAYDRMKAVLGDRLRPISTGRTELL